MAPADIRTVAERIESLGWSDPQRAARLIDAAATPAERSLLDSQMLEVSGKVYTDTHRDADVAATLGDLKSAAGRGDRSAATALRYVRAYAFYHHGRNAAAAAELNAVDTASIPDPAEQYRWLMLRGANLRGQRHADAAATALRSGLVIAQNLKDAVRSVHAMILLATAYVDAADLERASEQLGFAQALAIALGDESLLEEVDGGLADLARRRTDPAAERGLRLSALEHAKLSGSDKGLADALFQLSGSYLRAGDFRESLKYSKSAAPLIARVGTSSDESGVLLNEGLALIALGSVRLGQEYAERAIAETLARDDSWTARDLLRAYAGILSRSGYLMMAIQVYQRVDTLGDQLSSNARDGTAGQYAAANEAVVEARVGVSASDDSQPSASASRERRLWRQLVMAIVLGMAGMCAALVWSLSRVKRAEGRAHRLRERDDLTGLWNRRYFNEQVLPVGERPMNGCVLLADLDHFKRINDTWGYPAGDAVLKRVSELLVAALRDNDTLIRWDGEAFLLVLESVTPEQANQTAERLLDAARQGIVPWKGDAINCTLSIGYACFPLNGAAGAISLPGALGLVEKALYEAKRRGRDRACLISAVGGPANGPVNVVPGDRAGAAYERTIELTEMGVAA